MAAHHFSIFRPANLCVRAGSGGVGTGARHECPGCGKMWPVGGGNCAWLDQSLVTPLDHYFF